jgi:predicted Fe-S protein YdhL (DUF1289 family)
MDVPSPCIDVCSLNRDDVCVGCGRHIDEITAWSGAEAAVKLRIVAAARARLAHIAPQALDRQAADR